MTKTSKGILESKEQDFKKQRGGLTPFFELPRETRLQFERLKSSIVLASKKQAIKSVLLTSYNHGEGTSTIAASLAASLAQDRKYSTLLVDANTRSPGLLEIASGYTLDDTLVFSDLLTPEISEPPLPKPSSQSNLLLVPSGTITYHPSEVFDHTKFGIFIKNVTKVFDLIILDGSPIGRYYDSMVLASHVDGVIVVTEAEKTTFHELRIAKQAFQDENIPVLGIVLNRRRFYIPQFIFERFLR